MSIRVVVADDQTAVREGLSLMLSLLDDIEVVGEAADGEQALELVGRERPDVALMDLRMPRRDGVSTTAMIREQFPETRVVVLTTFADDEHILGALRAGAVGYLTKDAGRVQIAQAVRAAAIGQGVLDPQVQQRLLAAATGGAAAAGGTAARAERELPDGLTAREAEVLRLIAAGLSNKEIAKRLFVTEVTVKSHVNRLFAKAGVRDRAQAVRYAYQHGLSA
ncbi:LuxR family transcriptional regulator [Actinoplanes sp. SE50]|uniref:response regulator n=1 Tax=unclassified Actinoplanes TaxID=2626549 RepID=UPI00023ECDF1|nr:MULTISPECIES: response regulator transcription factor [unclassified Actinoplanes]AEV82105.1 Response regulator protein vraR [Actinoplanes sp. SE50/110]ATO80504.1 LuxR family transcriptional regulator [Actinoplanes sp. SE50]SLL97910.1 two-component system response regulator [Actinoplanes sp. SE50/110]